VTPSASVTTLMPDAERWFKLGWETRRPWPLRVVADALEGAAKPVGADAEAVVRLAPMFQRTAAGEGPAGSAILAGCLISPPACV